MLDHSNQYDVNEATSGRAMLARRDIASDYWMPGIKLPLPLPAASALRCDAA